jgi:hypothetical protein
MIHEYALEPELVATWSDRRDGRYFIEKFGVGSPRIVSRFPKRWKRMVWDAYAGGDDLDRKRLIEVVSRLSEVMVKRPDAPWDQEATWLENAEGEHARVPFHAILARANPRACGQVLAADDLDDDTYLWKCPTGQIVPRSASAMASAVAGILRTARVVVLVDPYFGPESGRHRRPLQAFLRALVNSRSSGPPARVEVHCSFKSEATEEFFRSECETRLPQIVPAGLEITLFRLRERAGGESLHNRYILTDIGGVSFGFGLDEGDEGATDDLQLLDRVQYEERWQQYANEPPAFDRPEAPVVIVGKGRG